MPLTEGQQRKLDNYRAQYNSILGNITMVNNELERTLEIKAKIIDSIKLLDKELDLKEKELINFSEQIVARKQRLAYRNADLDTKEERINKKEEKVEAKQEQLTESIRKTASSIKIKSDKLKVLEKEIKVAKKFLTTTIEQTGYLENSLIELEKTKKELTKQIAQEQKWFENETQKQHGMILDLQKTLLDLQNAVEREQEKVSMPIKQLELREKEMDRKEKDFGTLTRRWNKWFKQNFPNQEFKL